MRACSENSASAISPSFWRCSILLNTYPLITSENLTFRSKQSSLQGSVSVMVTALSGLEELSEENVAGAMTLVEETGILPRACDGRLGPRAI